MKIFGHAKIIPVKTVFIMKMKANLLILQPCQFEPTMPRNEKETAGQNENECKHLL